jgi:hypothetical protein
MGLFHNDKGADETGIWMVTADNRKNVDWLHIQTRGLIKG